MGDGVGELTGFSLISLNRECFTIFRFSRSSRPDTRKDHLDARQHIRSKKNGGVLASAVVSEALVVGLRDAVVLPG